MSFKEPKPALSNVMDTNELAPSLRERGVREGCGVGLLVPVSGALSSPDRAPSPTCPFIKNRQRQKTNQHKKRTKIAPRLKGRVTICPISVGDRASGTG